VTTRAGDEIPTATFVWTAGVQPAPFAARLGLPVDARGRVEVDGFLAVRGVPHVYAIGDVAAAHDRRGGDLPMVSPPAMQAGRHVARMIAAGLDGRTPRRFRYVDKGTLATIGRRAAVGKVGPLRFRGFVGWVVWLVVHLWYLIGFENRLRVLLRFAWYYVRLDRPVRSVIRADGTAQ
jgi:NADH dehydrogenase